MEKLIKIFTMTKRKAAYKHDTWQSNNECNSDWMGRDCAHCGGTNHREGVSTRR